MIDFRQLTNEEKLFQSHVIDAVRAAREKRKRKFIGFLDLRQQAILDATVSMLGFSDWRLYGGFPKAERKVAGFFPEEPQDWEESFPIQAITLRYRMKDVLSHRDFLGALMSLRISREMIGDILVEPGRAVLFVLEQAVPLLFDECKQVGRVGVSLEKGAQDLDSILPTIAPVKGTIPSPRLDAVVAFLTRLSREKAQGLIRQERVKVDGQIRTDTAGLVEPGCLLSVRGYGKYVIEAFDGVSKKGRLHITAGHYE